MLTSLIAQDCASCYIIACCSTHVFTHQTDSHCPTPLPVTFDPPPSPIPTSSQPLDNARTIGYVRRGVAHALIQRQDAILASLTSSAVSVGMLLLIVTKVKWDETSQVVTRLHANQPSPMSTAAVTSTTVRPHRNRAHKFRKCHKIVRAHLPGSVPQPRPQRKTRRVFIHHGGSTVNILARC